MPYVSVIMPTYNQGAFISRAIKSLQLQTLTTWELIIINDGSTDYTDEVIQDYLADTRIRYFRNESNQGLGYSINIALSYAKYALIAYLPSDDIYYSNHLKVLTDTIGDYDGSIIAYSGMKYNYNDSPVYSEGDYAFGEISTSELQLVQVLHKKTDERWIERRELVTDDLDKMFWSKIAELGGVLSSDQITCEWVNHPEQRHKIINENHSGGIFLYKQFYNVKEPLRFKSKSGALIDENVLYKDLGNKRVKETARPLKILIVGELAYNAERILALEEYGHQLFGLWMPMPHCYNTTGPLPFGKVKDIDTDNWLEEIKEIEPDIIYALLNHQAIPFAHYILTNNPGIPFVWHFKEGPFYARQSGMWKELAELYTNSDGQIFTNQESHDWYAQFLVMDINKVHILDGDLPKQDYFFGEQSSLLSEQDGEIHTVLPGRPMGITPDDVKLLAENRIHLHFYGDVQQTFWRPWIEVGNQVAQGYLHIHKHIYPQDWIKEFSKYDAGWLHVFNSENNGELIKASWLDINYPARMPTMAAAGVPMIQKNFNHHIVATGNIVKKLNIGIFYDSIEDLAVQLRNKERLQLLRMNTWNERLQFTFDYHVEDLIKFFYKIIDLTRSGT